MRGLGFDIFARDKTAQAFASVDGKVNALNKRFDGLKKSVGNVAKLFATGLALNFFKGAGQAAEHINDLSNRLGIGAKTLSQYQLVANNTGVELDTIAKGMQKLAISSVDAAEKGGATADALKFLGINVQQFASMPIDQKFSTLATAIQGVEDPAKRLQIAMTLMGKSGAEMLQVMADGGEGLASMQARADELGITLRQTQTTAIDTMMDSFGELALAAKGLAQDILAFLAPAITKIVQAVSWAISRFQVFDGGMTKIGWGMVSLGHKVGIVSDEMYKLATIEAYERIHGGVEKTNVALEEQDELLQRINNSMNNQPTPRRGNRTQEDLLRTGQISKDVAAGMEDDFGRTADTIDNKVGNALEGINFDFKDLKGTAINALNAIGNAIIDNIVDNLRGGGGGGGGFNPFGGGGGGGFDFGSIFDSIGGFLGFASGGDHKGGLRIVGERGAELEATGRSRIFNAAQTKDILSGAANGGNAPIQISYHIDARGADAGVEQRLRATIKELNASVEPRAIAAVVNARRRNPSLMA